MSNKFIKFPFPSVYWSFCSYGKTWSSKIWAKFSLLAMHRPATAAIDCPLQTPSTIQSSDDTHTERCRYFYGSLWKVSSVVLSAHTCRISLASAFLNSSQNMSDAEGWSGDGYRKGEYFNCCFRCAITALANSYRTFYESCQRTSKVHLQSTASR